MNQHNDYQRWKDQERSYELELERAISRERRREVEDALRHVREKIKSFGRTARG